MMITSATRLTFQMRTSRIPTMSSWNGSHRSMLVYAPPRSNRCEVLTNCHRLAEPSTQPRPRSCSRQCLLEPSCLGRKRNARTIAQSRVLYEVCAVFRSSDRVSSSGRCSSQASARACQAWTAYNRRRKHGHESLSSSHLVLRNCVF